MPIQSKRISLSALGIQSVPGMVYGHHLRVGFDPKMGFPSCGFEIFRRPHRKEEKRSLDIGRLFAERRPARFRWGFSQSGLQVFHPLAPRPQQSADGGIEMSEQALCFSFRATPFAPDSNPKVCEVKLRVRSSGAFVVNAYDDRHDGEQFDKILVARARRRGFPVWDPGWFDRFAIRVYRLWTGTIGLLTRAFLGERLAATNAFEDAGARDMDSRFDWRPDLSNEPAFRDLGTRFFPELLDHDDGGERDAAPTMDDAASNIAGWRRFAARALMGINRLASNMVFARWRRIWGTVHDVTLRADLISLVEVEAPAGARVVSFEYVEVSDARWHGMVMPTEEPWGITKEIPLLLPTADEVPPNRAGYPTCEDLGFSVDPDDVESKLPEQRLASGFVASTGSADVHGEYADFATMRSVYLGPEPDRVRFENLNAALRDLQQHAPSQQFAVEMTEAGSDANESATFSPMFLILAGAVDPHFARMVGLALIDGHAKSNDHFDYKVVSTWNGVEHAWITHDVFPGRDGLLSPPEAAEITPVADATRPGDVKTNVELTWDSPDEVQRLLRENQHVGYHVFRRRVDEPGSRHRLTQCEDELTGVMTPDLQLLAQVQGEGVSEPGPDDVGNYLDRPPAYGAYDYGLQAEDLFGRRSEIVWTEDVPVPVLIDPPPVSELYAFYLDSDDPEQEDLLDSVALRVLDSTGQLGMSGRALLIEFRYPKASIDAVAGDVERFDVFYRHGHPNELVGTIDEPAIVGTVPPSPTDVVDADIDMTTATPVDVGIDGFGGERSRGAFESTGEYYTVSSSTRLDTYLVRLRIQGRRDYLPRPGGVTLSIGRGGGGVGPHPLFVSPTDPAAWTGFDLRHPQGPTDQGAMRLSGSDAITLAPLPVDVAAADVIMSRTDEPPANLDEGEAAPPQDWVYRIVVKHVDIPLPAGLADYSGAVTVQVVTGAGRQSQLPAPAFARRRAYEPPLPLTELATADFELATRPDFQGRIGARLTWPKMAGIRSYNVYRAEVQSLVQELGVSEDLAVGLTESEANRAEVKLLGGQIDSIRAFTLVTPVAIRPDTDPQAGSRHRWVDRFAAPRDGAYVYRIQPVGAFGQVAEWPPDAASDNENRDRCILVLQKNRDALLAPSIYEITPLDRSLSIVVRKPTTQTITGMRIYKTDDAAAVRDVRKMTIIHRTIPFDHPRVTDAPADNGVPALLVFTDEKVRVGVQYYYRILFVDEFGNVSMPSEPLAGTPRSLAPPEPPELTAQRTAMATIQLSWVASHDEGEVRVQRKRSGESAWLDVADTWHSPSDSAVDADAEGIVAHRLLLRDAKGRFVYSGPVITEES